MTAIPELTDEAITLMAEVSLQMVCIGVARTPSGAIASLVNALFPDAPYPERFQLECRIYDAARAQREKWPLYLP